MPDEPFLTTAEVMAYLKINLQTVYALIRSGDLPAMRVGRQWRFRRSDIDARLSGREAELNSRRSVLIVEDDDDLRSLLSRALRIASFEVDTAPNAEAGLELARDGHYDLLITDVMMPGMDGLALVRALRERTPRLPVIVITGFSTEHMAIDAANLHVAGYLTKPFRVPEIIAAAQRAVPQR